MKRIIIFLIKAYQITPSHTHSSCRFIPTCSQYMIDAILKYGTFKGICLGLKRIIRCHPGGKYGYDPVKWKEFYEKNI